MAIQSTKNEIIKLDFKQETQLHIEIVKLENIIKDNKDLIILPHRTNFSHFSFRKLQHYTFLRF